MSTIPIRFVKLYAEGDCEGISLAEEDWDEGKYVHGEALLEVKPEEAALALVDFWDSCWHEQPMAPQHGRIAELNAGRTWQNRAKQITLEKVVPVLQCARACGMTVVHLPSAQIAVKYPQCQQLAKLNLEEQEDFKQYEPLDWPPKEWAEAWYREHMERGRSKKWLEMWDDVYEKSMIALPVAPLDDEIVAASGAQFHHICKERKIRVIFYVGFALNMCVINRPGALLEMRDRGYLTIILRDCTTAIETADTYNGLWMTKAFINWLELLRSYSSDSDAFLKTFG